jgi:hypothetical protein
VTRDPALVLVLELEACVAVVTVAKRVERLSSEFTALAMGAYGWLDVGAEAASSRTRSEPPW